MARCLSNDFTPLKYKSRNRIFEEKNPFVIGKKGCVLYINAYYPQIIMVLRWLNKDNVIKEYFLLY